MTETSDRWWDVALHPEQVNSKPVESPEWRPDAHLTSHADEFRRIA